MSDDFIKVSNYLKIIHIASIAKMRNKYSSCLNRMRFGYLLDNILNKVFMYKKIK